MNMSEAKKKWWEDNAIYNIGNGQHGKVVDMAWEAACKWQKEKDADIANEISLKYYKQWRANLKIHQYEQGLADGADEAYEAIKNQE